MDALAAGFMLAYPLPVDFRHKKETIAANSEETIWEIDLSDESVLMFPNYVLIVSTFGVNLGPNSTLSWETDTENQMEPMRSSTWQITSSLGSTTPLSLNPGIVVVRKSTMTVTNSGSSPEDVELFVWGGFIKKSLYRRIENLILG